MNNTRQDAWNQEEDVLLAETVLRYIREGKTQLEAFKEVAKKLSRTPAACGFRWNASVRKQYQEAIQLAKKDRKQGDAFTMFLPQEEGAKHGEGALDAAISLLEKMKVNYYSNEQEQSIEEKIKKLKQENERLRQQVKRYEDAWNEMGQLWQWVGSKKDSQPN
ncbi:RsfA family transcriptional regulator [Radiobacillus deserti]|uniref:RsfA family transcriptional regulator n=1 Tax=Radiobacillus deserti TaxID=2594883 RepID=A0A516KFC0_9BACI|nr:RsfA family transcriptional regulator [Radiobacillus deserti]QDP40080.1 RsfA family transcriptional regulator [Radiobacillus deserti]